MNTDTFAAVRDKIKILDSNVLKLIAVISMTIDHIGFILFPDQMWLRCIGRLAFPIYAYLITEGYLHTRNVKKYLLRLGILAVLSEIPFNLAISGSISYPASQNVFLTLFLGLLAIALMDKGQLYLPQNLTALSILPVMLACIAAISLRTDYDCYGILIISLFYIAKTKPLLQFLSIGVMQYLMGTIQLFGQLAFIPIFLYNGKKGRTSKFLQWAFYLYYPLHLLLLYLIAANLR